MKAEDYEIKEKLRKERKKKKKGRKFVGTRTYPVLQEVHSTNKTEQRIGGPDLSLHFMGHAVQEHRVVMVVVVVRRALLNFLGFLVLCLTISVRSSSGGGGDRGSSGSGRGSGLGGSGVGSSGRGGGGGRDGVGSASSSASPGNGLCLLGSRLCGQDGSGNTSGLGNRRGDMGGGDSGGSGSDSGSGGNQGSNGRDGSNRSNGGNGVDRGSDSRGGGLMDLVHNGSGVVLVLDLSTGHLSDWLGNLMRRKEERSTTKNRNLSIRCHIQQIPGAQPGPERGCECEAGVGCEREGGPGREWEQGPGGQRGTPEE